VRSWWERQAPKPTQPFPAVVAVCARALRAGWTETELAHALDEVPVVSGGALDLWRNRRGNGQARSGATIEGALAVADAIRRRREALR
jgi:hypothetical protein